MTTHLTDSPAAAIRELYRLVDAGDLDGLAMAFTDDAHYDRPGYPRLVGRPTIDGFYRRDRVIASGAHTLESVVVSGTEVAVRGSFSGVLRDGSAVTHRFAEFFTVAHTGQVATRETFFAVAHV